MGNNTLITHCFARLLAQHWTQEWQCKWWFAPLFVCSKIWKAIRILLGSFNVSELHVKVKLPLRRWQRLKGGSQWPQRLLQRLDSIFHVFLMWDDMNIQKNRRKCSFHMWLLYNSLNPASGKQQYIFKYWCHHCSLYVCNYQMVILIYLVLYVITLVEKSLWKKNAKHKDLCCNAQIVCMYIYVFCTSALSGL